MELLANTLKECRLLKNIEVPFEIRLNDEEHSLSQFDHLLSFLSTTLHPDSSIESLHITWSIRSPTTDGILEAMDVLSWDRLDAILSRPLPYFRSISMMFFVYAVDLDLIITPQQAMVFLQRNIPLSKAKRVVKVMPKKR